MLQRLAVKQSSASSCSCVLCAAQQLWLCRAFHTCRPGVLAEFSRLRGLCANLLPLSRCRCVVVLPFPVQA